MLYRLLYFNFLQKIWPEGYQLAGAVGFKFPYFTSTPLSMVVPQASPVAIKLMEILMDWNPNNRPTAQAGLKHPYFQVISTCNVYTKYLPSNNCKM